MQVIYVEKSAPIVCVRKTRIEVDTLIDLTLSSPLYKTIIVM